MLSLIPSFKDSFFSNLSEIAVDLTEVGIDSFLKEGVLKDIPFVSVFYKLGNIAVSIRDRHMLQKTLAFLQEVDDGIVSDEERYAYKQRLESSPKFAERELGYILVSIDRYVDAIKSKILARFYVAYIDTSNKFNWVDFCILSEILDGISIYDFDALLFIYENKDITVSEVRNKISLFQITRLEKCGVVIAKDQSVYISPQGKIFCELSRIKDFLITNEGSDINGN